MASLSFLIPPHPNSVLAYTCAINQIRTMMVMGPPAVILSKKTRTTTQLGATDFLSAQQIYAEGSFQNN